MLAIVPEPVHVRSRYRADARWDAAMARNRNVLFRPITRMFPASFLREHPDVTLVVTESVAEDPRVEPE